MNEKLRKRKLKQAHLRYLFKKWTNMSAKKKALHASIARKGTTTAMNPSLLQKITKWIEQIAHLEQKENDVISKIMHIEKQHKTLRKEKKLRRVDELARQDDLEKKQKRKNRFWFWFFMILLLSHKRKPYTQLNNG